MNILKSTFRLLYHKKRSFGTLFCEKCRKGAAAIYILRKTLSISSCYPKDERSRNSSVGVATRYGLNGPGMESRWGRDFPHLSRPALMPNQPPVQWVLVLFRG